MNHFPHRTTQEANTCTQGLAGYDRLSRPFLFPATSFSIRLPPKPHLPTHVRKVSVLGLCIRAETALQQHELEQRLRENSIRREARIDLARRGLVATETEIAKWKAERERARAEVAAVVAEQQASASAQ